MRQVGHKDTFQDIHGTLSDQTALPGGLPNYWDDDSAFIQAFEADADRFSAQI